MMKRFKVFLMSVTVVLLLTLVSGYTLAADENVQIYTEGIFSYTVTDGKATIVKCDAQNQSSLVIPEKLGGYVVVELANKYLSDCTSVTEITIPATIKKLGSTGLTKKFNKAYFADIKSYLNVETSTIKSMFANELYFGGELATDIVIPDGVKVIPDDAFCYCETLKSIHIPASVEMIEQNAFVYCTALKNVYVESIEAWIELCSKIEKVYASGSWSPMFMGEKNFYVGGELLVDIVIPESVTRVPVNTFFKIKSLKSITFHSGMEKNNADGFFGCDLEKVYVPDFQTWINVSSTIKMDDRKELYVGGELFDDIVISADMTEIPAKVFSGLNSVKTITIPSSVKTISKDAFYNTDIESVYAESLAHWTSIDFKNEGSNPLRKAKNFYVGGELIQQLVITQDVESIESYAFYGYKFPKGVKFAGGSVYVCHNAFGGTEKNDLYVDKIEHWLNVTFSGKSANPFYDINKFYVAGELCEEIVIPENVTIPEYSFCGLKQLKKIIIPASVKTKRYTFSDSGIESIFLGNKEKTAENTMVIEYSFSAELARIKEVTLGYGVKKISYKAFASSKNLNKLVIYDGLEEIGKMAFYDTGITELTIPSSVTIVGENAFGVCRKLKSVVFGDKTGGTANTQINNYAFSNCTGLESVTFNTGVKAFAYNVFDKCKNLKDLYINDLVSYLNIKSIDDLYYRYSVPGYWAENFYLNGKLIKNLVIPEGVTQISNMAFDGCKTLETVSFPKTLKKIGMAAFRRCTNLKNVMFPEGLTEIDESAFFNCSSFTNLEFPKSIKYIEMDAFAYCNNLEYVIMYLELNASIKESAFGDTPKLKQIIYSGTKEEWKTFVKKNNEANLSRVPVYYNYNPKAVFAPESISASQTSDSVTLKWSAVNGVSGYRVYIKNTKTGKWDVIVKSTGKNTSTTIKKLLSGTKYSFAVKSFINTGVLEMWSPDYATINTLTKPESPKKLTAKGKNNKITLSWSAVKGVKGYRVYRKTSKGWKVLKTTGGTSYTVEGVTYSKKYTFAVRDYIKYKGKNYFSPVYKTVTVTAPHLDTPEIKLSSKSKGKVNLSWNDVNGEKGYQVWYSEKEKSGYKKYDNYNADTKKATVKGLKSKKTFYFKIRAYKKLNGKYVYSSYSAVKKIKVK